MELLNLARRHGLPALVSGLSLVAAAGCHSNSAGNHPTDAAVERTPDLSEKLPAPEVYCAPDAQGGGGVCPINFCGQPKAASLLAPGELAEMGADVRCTPGDVCVPDGPTADGTKLQLRCVEPLTATVAFGAACTKGAGAATRCKNDALCIGAPGAPAATFCSQLCRSDLDCPTNAFCLEYASEMLPNGSTVNLGFCTPKDKIAAPACTREAQCAANQGCVSYGARTGLLTCKNLGATNTKSIGEACTAGTQCRSGECFDRDFKLPGLGHRAFCSGHCSKNSDCAADQRCGRLVVANNNTPADPFDDVVAGYCQTLFVSDPNTACKGDGDCTTGGADSCDVAHGLCYKLGAVVGAPCTADTQCDVGAVCTTGLRFPGGYCQPFGCEPGQTTGVDSCPGAKSACSQRFADEPVHGCYEGCVQSGDCSRFGQNYVCAPPTSAPGVASSICLYNQGV